MDLSLITVTSQHDHAGLAEAVLEQFAIKDINLEYITEGSGKESCVVMSFCVRTSDEKISRELMEKLKSEGRINTTQYRSPVCFIGIYGPHFREKPGLAYRLCSALSRVGINILGISSSISTVSCLIDESNFKQAKNGILEYFEPI